MPRQRTMRLTVFLQLVAASCLVALGAVLVATWLLLLVLALNHLLDPWNNAGVVLAGPVVVALAAFAGVPGMTWSRALASRHPTRWAKVLRRTGSAVLALGAAAVAAAVIYGIATSG